MIYNFCLKLFLLAMFFVHIQSANAVIAYGAFITCESWNITKADEYDASLNELKKLNWVAGFMSGINFWEGYDHFPKISTYTVKDYIDLYCKKNPQNGVSKAIEEVILKLKK